MAAAWQHAAELTCRDSLPLMGIRNSINPDELKQAGPDYSWGSRAESYMNSRASHYPSWGSETQIDDLTMQRVVSWRAHYPSWGSETRRRLRVRLVTRRLTTPHGDRNVTSASAARLVELTTPHGDQKRRLRQSARTR